MMHAIATYLLCLLSITCEVKIHYQTNKMQISVYHNITIVKKRYEPYVHVYRAGSKQPINFYLDSGSYNDIVNLNTEHKLSEMQSRHSPIKLRKVYTRYTFSGNPDTIIPNLTTPVMGQQLNIKNTIGRAFLSRQTSVLYTGDMLYINFFKNGIKNCGTFKTIMWNGVKTSIFKIKANGRINWATFDSGTNFLIMGTYFIKGLPIKKISLRLYEGSRMVPVQYIHIKAAIGYGVKGNKNKLTLNAPKGLLTNFLMGSGHKKVPFEYIIGWPLVMVGGYYVNNPLRQQCFIPKKKIDKMLHAIQR